MLAYIPRPPNVPLLRAFWSLLDGIWGSLKGSWGVLVDDGARADRLGISARFKVFSWLVAFSADPSKHGRAHGHQGIHARTIVSYVWKIRSPEASDSKSIHRCQCSNAWFLEASDSRSIHRCQLSKVRFLEASDSNSIHPSLPPWQSPVPRSIRCEEHPPLPT